MTADGVHAHQPIEPDYPAHKNGGDATPFSAILLRQALADEDAFWTALETREQELRDLLDVAPTPQEQRAARADLTSLAWLTDVWDGVQHNARCLKNFGHWLQTPPSREKLFAEYCRHAVPAEWDRAAREETPPFIFSSLEKYRKHLEHCQLCDAQRQLAEGRRLRSEPSRPTWGDQLVRDFFVTFCGEAFAAACDPAWPAHNSRPGSRIWSESPPLRLIPPADRRTRSKGEFETEITLLLIGPPQPARFELNVTAQFIVTATRQPEPPMEVWPRVRGAEAVLEWRPAPQGHREFPLTVPSPAMPGRMILRYSVRPAASPGIRGSHAPRPTGATAVNALMIDFLSRPRE
jgi:hypothetical protein